MSGPVFPPPPGQPPMPPPPGQPPMGAPWPGPHGQYPQQPPGPWPQPTPPAGPPGGGRRWVLLALTLVAVIAVTVACTMWLTHRDSGNQAGPASGSPQASGGSNGEIASANDTGPVGIITEDPTCEPFLGMQTQVTSQLADWNNRDGSIPSSSWTPAQRQSFETAARVFRAEADQLVPLARDTPHRVTREIYEQIIAYDRAYADAIPEYRPADDDLATARNSLGATQVNVCTAISSFVAANRGPSVPEAAPPTRVATLGDPANPKRFLTSPSEACPKIKALAQRQASLLDQWVSTANINIPASQRSAADKVTWDTAATVFGRGADDLDQLARSSGNPVMEDFLILSAQYFRAYVGAIPTYVSSDNQLYEVAQKSRSAVRSACDLVQG